MNVKEESEKVGLKLNIQKTKIMASGPITSWQIDGETMETVTNLIFWAPKSLQVVTEVMKLKKTLALWKKSYDQPRQHIKKRHYFANKGSSSKSYGFSSSHIWMWESDIHKESWALKKWWFWTVVLEKTLESPLDCKEIQPVHPKGNQTWMFIGRTDVEAETPILWPPDVKNWLIWKDPNAGKERRQEEKGMTEDEMVGWHHWLDGHEFEHASGAGDGQGSLACCSAWSHKESDTTKRLNWTEMNWVTGHTYTGSTMSDQLVKKKKWHPNRKGRSLTVSTYRYNVERAVSSINAVGESRQQYAKKNPKQTLGHYFTSYTKMNSSGLKTWT